MQGVLAERPVNKPRDHIAYAPSAYGRSSEPEGNDPVFKTPKAKASKALWLSRQQSTVTESCLSHQDLEAVAGVRFSNPPSEQAQFKVPRTPVSVPARKRKSAQAPQVMVSRNVKSDCDCRQKSPPFPALSVGSQETAVSTPSPQAPTPGVFTPRQGGSYSTPVAQRKREKLAFPETPSPSPGDAALPSPLTTTNGVSQRVLPSVGLGLELEEAQEEDGSMCGICHDRDGDGLIVYCDGCDLAVHPSCYGYPLSREVPEGQWLCDRCEQPTTTPPPRCSLCPSSRGAMKRTTDWQWAHLSCSFFIPEVFFLGPNGNDYVHTLQVPRVRFRMMCHVCGNWHGACVHCTETGCDKWFHVTCGQEKGFAIEYRRNKHGRDIVLTFCAAHTAKWEKDKREKKRFKISSKTSVKKW